MSERVNLYSSSLYQTSVEENASEEVYEGLKAVQKVLEENREYIKILSSTEIKSEERETLVEEAFGGRVHTFCVNFMKILAKRRIFDVLIPCIKEFEKKYLKDNNIEFANIVTAVELTEEKKKDVLEKLSRSMGKKLNATFCVREEIIGGIIVESENSAIDASVAGRLKNIERHIKN